MKSIVNTFVAVAPDCPADSGTTPSAKAGKPTIAGLEHELLSTRPYELTLEDLIYEVHLRRLGFSADEIAERGEAIRADLFVKPHPCMRASALTKRYGWGVHHDEQGRMKLIPMESAEYRKLASKKVAGVDVVFAMRSKRSS